METCRVVAVHVFVSSVVRVKGAGYCVNMVDFLDIFLLFCSECCRMVGEVSQSVV